MNIMKKLLNQRDSGDGSFSAVPPDHQLSLTHLNKLFNELKATSGQFISGSGGGGPSKYDVQAHQAISDYEQKIYRLLPLFLKVFGHLCPPGSGSSSNQPVDMFERFADLTTFTQITSRLMVSEIRRRASNKTTEDASQAIIDFLEMPKEESIGTTTPATELSELSQSKTIPLSPSGQLSTTTDRSNNNNNNQKGWILLSTLNLLVCNGSATLISIMAATSLPSTLVKCLYLFFDLPVPNDSPTTETPSQLNEAPSDQNPSSSPPTTTDSPSSPSSTDSLASTSNGDRLSSKDRRLLLQRVFAQLLTRLCSHQASLAELSRKDDLALLFSAITSWCPKHNQVWRQTAGEVMVTMARSQVTNCAYLHEKNCISIAVENMSRMSELSTTKTSEITDMLSSLINFLFDVTANSPTSAAVLLDDFKNALGYHLLVDFSLKLESNIPEDQDSLRRVVSIISQFAKVGTSELKPRPLSVNQLFIMDDFSMPRPTGREAVRNLSAFNVLQTLWLKGKSDMLQDLLLGALLNLYRDDRANYFILDSQNTLSQFAEKLQLRPLEIQEKFFTILEFVIYELRYVPCKELISISLIIKSRHSLESSIACLLSLLSIVKFNPIFRDVYREVGLLDIITSLLVKHLTELTTSSSHASSAETQMAELLAECTYHMLTGPNNANCSLVHDNAASKTIFGLLPSMAVNISKQLRKCSFLIMQQLILSNSGEEHLANLLTLMHNTLPIESNQERRASLHLTLQQELSLRSNILKSLLIILRDSHRCRALFRKVGGFVYVMSVLVGMEGCLAKCPAAGRDVDRRSPENELLGMGYGIEPNLQWNDISETKIWNLIRCVFTALTTAMRFEPANAKFFATEICPTSLTDSIRLLGCFTHEVRISETFESVTSDELDENSRFASIFSTNLNLDMPPKAKLDRLEAACLVMRLMYDMALDLSDKQTNSTISLPTASTPTNSCQPDRNGHGSNSAMAKRPPSLALGGGSNSNDPPVIIHSSVIIAMLHLIPSIPSEELQCCLMERLRCLLKLERNQQVMCEAGLVTEILSDKYSLALVNEKHPLHPTVQYMLERLAAQCVEPIELRSFLRLGNPLNCIPMDERGRDGRKYSIPATAMTADCGGPISLSRIKTIVSMTTPKDCHNQNLIPPPFIEFDMNQEGFSCLFLPSVAPLTSGSSGGATNILTGAISGGDGPLGGGAVGVNGGIGTGERTFPPQSGITFLTWICVDKFSHPSDEAHNVRMLTILRGSQSGQEFACLQIQVSARDKALLISTQETPIFGDGDLLQPSGPISFDADYNLRIWSPELIQEGQWHHIAIVLNRAVLKNSSATIYIDGNAVASHKLHYISNAAGGCGPNSGSYVNGFIGTPPQWRKVSKLIWKQGPCHLLEEPLTSNIVSQVYNFGPNYIGSYQGCLNTATGLVAMASQHASAAQQQIPEDRVIFGLNGRATSAMTLAKMRRVYSKFDCRQISKILGLSSHENATPIYVLHNSAGHLCGPSRSLGAIVIGYIGARCFVPRPVALTVQDIGGCTLLLGMVASSKDVESLYASVKALVCVLKANKELVGEMERINGYQTLAMLLRRKRHFLNSHVLHLTFTLVGTLDVHRGRDEGSALTEIHQAKAFKDLLCDQIDLWAANDLLKSLLEHFNELLVEASGRQAEHKSKNVRILRELGLCPRLLQLLWDRRVVEPKSLHLIKSLIYTLLNQTSRQCDLLYFGQFIAALLPTAEDCEKPMEVVELRNSLLKIVLQLTSRNQQSAINVAVQEELVRILGFDWFLLFIQGSNVQKDTTAIGLVNLMILLSNPSLYNKFKDGNSNGGWLKDTEAVFGGKSGVQLLGFNVGSSSGSTSSQATSVPNAAALLTATKANGDDGVRIIRNDLFTIPGFQHLNMILSTQVNQPELYLILFQGLLGQFIHLTPNLLEAIESFNELSLDNIWNCLFGESKRISQKDSLTCPDLALTVLAMTKQLMWDSKVKISNYAVTLIQFFIYLYHNRKDFHLYCNSNVDFMVSLAQLLISDVNALAGPVTLANHPAKRHVMDFIRLIIVDSLAGAPVPPSVRGSHPVTFTFEIFADSMAASKAAQTELVFSMIEQLSSMAEVMAQQQQTEFIASQQQQQQLAAANIVQFAAIVTEKLWQDCYQRDPKEILDFELKLLMKLNIRIQSKNSSKGSGINEYNILYRSLNRTILYLLSRPLETLSDRMAMLEILQRIHSSKQLILISACNSDAEFFVCLTHCLLQLIDEERISLIGKRHHTTTWHVDTSRGADGIVHVQPDEGALLVASVSKKIWDEIYIAKKLLLEETLKVNLYPSAPAFGLTSVSPDLSQLRETLYEPTLRVWTTYIELEQTKGQKKAKLTSIMSLDSPSSPSPTAIITEKFSNVNKFAKVVGTASFVSKIVGGTTGAMSGAINNAVGREAKKELFKNSLSHSEGSFIKSHIPVWETMSKEEVAAWTLTHISIISDLIELNLKQKHQSDCHLLKYVYDDWLQAENELLVREKAVWGPESGSRQFDKWRLDMSEGPHRMRKKLMKNDLFFVHYPYRVDYDTMHTRTLKYKLPISFDSKEYFKRFRPESHGLVERDSTLDFGSDDDVSVTLVKEVVPFDGMKAVNVLPEKTLSQDADDADGSGFVDIGSDVTGPGSSSHSTVENSEQIETQTVLRLLEEGEKISHMFRVARIQGLDIFEGLLLFGKEHFYLIDGFTLLKTREIRDIDSLPSNMHDPIVPSSSPTNGRPVKKTTKKLCQKFAFEDIKEVHKRRYLLQPIALEVFSMDGRNSLLVFPRKLRNKVYGRYMSVATYITDNAADSLAGQKRNVSVESGTGLLSNLIGETSVTQRWVRGEISNFQYLMHLNTLAGRSYNDLMQYPIFPWILADYSSAELDLTSPSTFRDLSKPMGAQTPERLDQFRSRYKEWDDPHLDTPPYHYGTFYSSAMIVASYLIRMEPFTSHFLRLQGGHFDLADRMFHSVGDSYMSAAKNNMADIKELIPEFFYLPEFLLNANRFDLGMKQSGIRLNHVVLPQWAKDDPREFIRVHRMALECDYVSARLHEWIDLIFGFKQQGQAAEDSINVFHHLFYEGQVDIYTIDDPLKKNATIGFINNFGQIPKQLFKKPHPAKKVQTTNMSSTPLTPMLPSVGGLNSVLTGAGPADKVFIHHLDNLRPSMHPIKELRGAVGQIIQQEKTLLAVEQNKVLIPPNFNRYLAWGFADHSLRIGPYESDRANYIFESDILPPNGEILCCTVPNSRIFITAGTSSVINVWRLRSKNQKLKLIQGLYGHTEGISCLTCSQVYGIIVSGSRDQTCIVWDLNRLSFVRQLGASGGPDGKPVHPSPIAAIAINDLTGDIATCASNELFVWSINGDLLAAINTLSVPSAASSTAQNQFFPAAATQILCVTFSLYNEWDNENVIMTGSSDGVVRMWAVEFVQAPEEDLVAPSSSSCSIASTPDEEDALPRDHLIAPPSKDEIVRRMSLASVQAESNKGDNSEDSTEDSLSDAEDAKQASVHEDWVNIENPASTKRRPSIIKVSLPGKQGQKSEASGFIVLSPQDGLEGAKKSTKRVGIEEPPKLTLGIPKITTSKSDTSLVDSFIVINEATRFQRPEAVLREGCQWKREVIFKSKLTMHTAFERKDNMEPAAITALAVSKDNKTVFVGDARGRVFSWSVSETRTGLTDHWVKDDVVEACSNSACGTRFTFSERRHHCRNCGHVFCAKCSKFECEIVRLKIYKPVRVCHICYNALQKSQGSHPSHRTS